MVDLVGRVAQLDAVLDSCRSARGGALLVGPAGIGKTRLLDEALAALSDDRWHTERFVATSATREVPFGPLISLLPSVGGDRTELHAGVRQQLLERSTGRRTAVGVDDAHLLDPQSMACVTDLVHHSDIAVILSARTDVEPPPELTRLWTGGALTRVEIGPLDDDDVHTLAEELVGGPVAADLGAHLAELAQGVPLLVRELLFDARSLGAIEHANGVWRQVGSLRSGTRVQELVAARVRQLEAPSARLFELVALGEPLPIDLLDELEAEAIDRLERHGLVRVDRGPDGWAVGADHPLLSEALEAAMPTRRRIEVARELADRTVRSGCPRRGDALRVARWRATTGDELDADLAIAAGREALTALDLELAAELAEGAIPRRAFEGHLLLGEVRRLQARPDEADASLAVAAELAEDDEHIVRIAMWRSTLFAHHAGEPGAAIRLLEEAAEAVSDPVRALELSSEASFLAGLLGRFDDAVRTNRRILDHTDLDDETVWTARINLLYAQVMLGRLDGVDQHVDHAMSMVEWAEVTRPEGVDLLWALRTGIAVQNGRLDTGEHDALAHISRCVERGTLFGLTATIASQLLLLRGSEHLRRLMSLALDDLTGSDPFAARPIASALAAVSHAALGEHDQARRHLDDIPPSALDDVRAVAFIGRARAAVIAADRPDEAAAIVSASGRESIERLHISFGVLALYDAVLMGRPDLVADELAVASSSSPAPLVLAMSEHATAARRGDAPTLERTAVRFLDMGATRLASIASAHAAQAHEPGTDARRAAARAMRWARTIAPFPAPPCQVDGCLSDRELEVALEAATGRPSREIAERLYVSVRTVDNHLRQVYAKLGVAGRVGLQQVLGPRDGASPSGIRTDRHSSGYIGPQRTPGGPRSGRRSG